MATVSRARDIRHNRDVAVKFLDPGVAAAIGVERFTREIEVAAKLQHPHIVPVFDSGEADGRLFFVMPLIQGESLRSRLDREPRLPLDEAVRLAREIADALDYAHFEGLVHRDVKPENILLSRGHAMLADFGIARTRAGSAEANLTHAGTSLGTPRYMSPEQAAGEDDVGPASDIYSLGCVLFEMLAGEAPFADGVPEAALVRCFTETAPLIRTRRPETDHVCEEALARALERDPTRRYSSARAFGDALGAATPAARRSTSRSIAVLPLDNISPDPGNGYLADGLTEELIADLSKVSALRVIARNSAAAARARTANLREIAELLDVRYLLDGSVRRAGNQLRITAQLIDATTDAHLWAEKYAGTMDDVFDMQERIARAIVTELRARLAPDESASLTTRSRDQEVYELYLRGKHFMSRSVVRMPEAKACLEEALRRDPSFSDAACALALCHVLGASWGLQGSRAAWAKVDGLARQALAATPRSSAAHLLLASVALYQDWEWVRARNLLDQAHQLHRGGAEPFWGAWLLAFLGDVEGARDSAETARRNSPLDFLGTIAAAGAATYYGAFDEALVIAERLLALDPHFPEGYHWKGYTLLISGDPAGAIPWLEKAVELSNRWAWPVAKLGCAYAGGGREAEARALLAELEERANSGPITFTAVASLCLHLGERDAFYEWMERAAEDRELYLVSLRLERLWARERGEQRFEDLVRRVGIPY